jgi:NAD(P)-dependent dehydrogenase (short-subunit alcohol dehydrogenase family)
MKNIIITGASKGIGFQIANYLAKNDTFKIINISRSNSKNKKILDYNCDVSDYDDVKRAFDKIKKIDVLINNAAISDFSKNKIENFEKIIKTNLNGSFYCAYEAVKKLKKSKEACIINISSINAYMGFPNNPGYVSSKGAILSLTRSLALDYAKFGIKVNSISPGYIKSGMTLLSYKNQKKRMIRQQRTIVNRWGEPKDLFGAIEFLISNKSNYINAQDIIIDGGWKSKGL